MDEGNQDSISTIENNSYEKIDWNQMECYENIFDILDENHDDLEYTVEELNRYYTSGHIHSTMDEEETIEEDDIESMEEEEDTVLSQKFSQLSTNNEDEEGPLVVNKKRHLSTSSSADGVRKKRKLTDDDENDNENDDEDRIEEKQDQIPVYLLTIDKSFTVMVQKAMDTASSIEMNDLRQIAILMHQMADIHIQKQITNIYLLSGTGKLRGIESDLTDIDRRVWPMQVKSALLAKSSKQKSATLVETNKEVEHREYETLVHERLQELNEKIEQYQRQLNEKKNHLMGFTPSLETAIQNYVQQHGIMPLQMKRDLKIALLEHEYDAEILERKYVQEKPNDYQIDVAKRLFQARSDLEESKRELVYLKQRVFYNKPPISFESIQIAVPTSTAAATTTKMTDAIQKQLIRQKKLDLMAIQLVKAELKFYQSDKLFNAEYTKMKENHRNLVKNKGMPTRLSNLIEQRFTNITDKFRDIHKYKINYYLRSSYGTVEMMNKKKKKTDETEPNTKTIGFLPHLIMDTTHQLHDEQVQLLTRGPTYVPPCQMYISSSFKSIDDIVKKQYAPLKHQLASLFQKHRINIALKWEMETEVHQNFVGLFSISIPAHIRKRAAYEKTLIQSVRCSLTKHNLILRRTADNQNTFYVGNKQDFEAKANAYLSQSDAYEVLTTIDDEENNEEKFQVDLKKRIESMNFALGILRRTNALDKDLVPLLVTDATKMKLPYIYFLPDVSKGNELSLVPRIVSQQSATSKIAKYLYRLIQSFANEKMQTLTFRDEADVMQKLHYYVYNQHRLTPTTLFCRIKITNFYTLDKHETMIETVTYFLRENSVNTKVNKVSIMTIKNLLQLFFHNNLFRYQNKIYTIIKGSPNTMPLSELLSNIYLFDWQQRILKEVKRKNELFGRYNDEIFFTWNDSADALRSYLHAVQKHQTNVHFQLTIGPNVGFFNAYIANQEGQLYTRVYHDPSIQSHTLPYVVGHSKLGHSHWLRSALIRAVCYCSSVEDFYQERIYLELACLINGYTFLFVESHVYHFFNYFNTESMRYRSDQTAYHSFRSRWFDFLDMQRTQSDQLRTLDDNDQIIRLHYLYDGGPRCQFNQDFHQCWSKYFKDHPVLSNETTKIILTTKHFHSLNALLTQYKSWD